MVTLSSPLSEHDSPLICVQFGMLTNHSWPNPVILVSCAVQIPNDQYFTGLLTLLMKFRECLDASVGKGIGQIKDYGRKMRVMVILGEVILDWHRDLIELGTLIL
jgi:hypothetical protein